jgi:hypothetical protein
MVCYARPAIRMAAVVLVAFLIFERPVGHFFDAAALVMAIIVAIAVAAVAAAAAFAVFLSTRRRRARAGGCVSCTLRCQHAMTEGPRRFRLVSIADRTPSTPSVRRIPATRATAAAPIAAGARLAVPVGAVVRSLPVVSINGRPSPGHAAPAVGINGRPSPGHAAPAVGINGRPCPGHAAPAVRLPAGPDAPQWPDRPARRSPSMVGS